MPSTWYYPLPPTTPSEQEAYDREHRRRLVLQNAPSGSFSDDAFVVTAIVLLSPIACFFGR